MDTLSFVVIQIDKILAFKELPMQTVTSPSDSTKNATPSKAAKKSDESKDPFQVLHEPGFAYKLNKLKLAVRLTDA